MNNVSAIKRTNTAQILAIGASLFGLGHAFIVLFVRNADALQIASNVANPVTGLLASILMGMAAWSLTHTGSGERGSRSIKDNPQTTVPQTVARRRVLAWTLLSLATLSSAAGDIVWMVFEMILYQPPTPSIADVFYLSFYVLFLVGVLFIPVKRLPGLDWLKGLIDILIVMLAAFLALWIYILGPVFQVSSGVTLMEQIVVVIYPLADILMLWAQLIVLFSAAGYPLRSSLWILVIGLLVFIVGDVGYAFLSLEGTYQSGSWTDVAYSLAYALFGLAGYIEYYVARRRLTLTPRPFTPPPLWVQALPYVWVVLSYWILVSVMYMPAVLSKTRVAMFVAGITLLVVVRQVITLYENRRLSGNLSHLLQQVKQQASDLEQANREMHIEILERRRMAERLSYDALHDGLTGLPNRALFLDRLAQSARKKLRQPGFLYSVMFLDLDGFKLINDSLGHLLGDKLLVRVAGILRSCVRASDTVARLGGDEFVILVEDITDARSVVEMANRVQAELRQPIDLDGTLVYTTASIGIVQDVIAYERPEDLLRDADLAMYHAKSLGKARHAIFNPAMRTVAVSRLALEHELRMALDRREFFIEYQPVFNLPKRHPVGFEALLRWQHPERGRLDPGAFVGVAEEAGLMLPIGRWCLNEACQQARIWQKRFEQFGPLKMGVNISGRQFRDPGFVNMVREILQATHLDGGSLMLEVPENICLENLDTLRSAMGDLSALGVEIQIDDFGTGYSSLGYLQRLPVHAIKIDRSFIEPICAQGDPRAAGIVRAILAMMFSLGVETWAEGIETEMQLDELVKMGCQYGQGYYLGNPMLPGDLETWMEQYLRAPQR